MGDLSVAITSAHAVGARSRRYVFEYQVPPAGTIVVCSTVPQVPEVERLVRRSSDFPS